MCCREEHVLVNVFALCGMLWHIISSASRVLPRDSYIYMFVRACIHIYIHIYLYIYLYI